MGFLVAFVETGGGGAVGEYGADGAHRQDGGQVGGDNISYGAVRAALDVTGGDNVPQGDAVGDQEGGLFLYGRWDGSAEDGGYGAPEAVLRMPVEEGGLAGFDRGEATQDENAGRVLRVVAIDWGDGMSGHFELLIFPFFGHTLLTPLRRGLSSIFAVSDQILVL